MAATMNNLHRSSSRRCDVCGVDREQILERDKELIDQLAAMTAARDHCKAQTAEAHELRQRQVGDLKRENERLRELYDNLRGFKEKGWTIDHLMECEEALRCVEAEVERLRAQIVLMEPVLVAADRTRMAYDAMLEGRDIGRLDEWTAQ